MDKTLGTQGRELNFLTAKINDKTNIGAVLTARIQRLGYTDFLRRQGYRKEYEKFSKENQLNYEIGREMAANNKKFNMLIAWPESIQYPEKLNKIRQMMASDRIFADNILDYENIEKVEIY